MENNHSQQALFGKKLSRTGIDGSKCNIDCETNQLFPNCSHENDITRANNPASQMYAYVDQYSNVSGQTSNFIIDKNSNDDSIRPSQPKKLFDIQGNSTKLTYNSNTANHYQFDYKQNHRKHQLNSFGHVSRNTKINHRSRLSVSSSNTNIDKMNPLKKTKICDHWRKSRVCTFGESCWYAHGENDLRKGLNTETNSDEKSSGIFAKSNSSEGTNVNSASSTKPKPNKPKRSSTNIKGLTVKIPVNTNNGNESSTLPLSPAQERWISISGGSNDKSNSSSPSKSANRTNSECADSNLPKNGTTMSSSSATVVMPNANETANQTIGIENSVLSKTEEKKLMNPFFPAPVPKQDLSTATNNYRNEHVNHEILNRVASQPPPPQNGYHQNVFLNRSYSRQSNNNNNRATILNYFDAKNRNLTRSSFSHASLGSRLSENNARNSQTGYHDEAKVSRDVIMNTKRVNVYSKGNDNGYRGFSTDYNGNNFHNNYYDPRSEFNQGYERYTKETECRSYYQKENIYRNFNNNSSNNNMNNFSFNKRFNTNNEKFIKHCAYSTGINLNEIGTSYTQAVHQHLHSTDFSAIEEKVAAMPDSQLARAYMEGLDLPGVYPMNFYNGNMHDYNNTNTNGTLLPPPEINEALLPFDQTFSIWFNGANENMLHNEDNGLFDAMKYAMKTQEILSAHDLLEKDVNSVNNHPFNNDGSNTENRKTFNNLFIFSEDKTPGIEKAENLQTKEKCHFFSTAGTCPFGEGCTQDHSIENECTI